MIIFDQMKIKVITAYTDNYKSLFDYTSKSLISYCEKNGYDFEGYLIPKEYPKLPSFYKIELLLKDLESYDYVLWVDVDALILRPDFKLESLFVNDRNLYISNTINFVNCGVMMFRKSEWAFTFLNAIKDYDVEKNIYNIQRIDWWWEQAIIHDFLLSNRFNTYPNVYMVSQSFFNAFLYNYFGVNIMDGQLNETTFIFHLVGFSGRPDFIIQKFEEILSIYNVKWW